MTSRSGLWRGVLVVCAFSLIAGTNATKLAAHMPWRDEWSSAERQLIASMGYTHIGPAPIDPSNRVDADSLAAVLGRQLFEDTRLSRDGTVACASCHQPANSFQDGRALAVGLGIGTRRTMPLAGVAYSPWMFWDGRADSRWAQALGPLENAAEHGSTRLAIARVVRDHYVSLYQQVYGALPDVPDVNGHASPLGSETERARWDALTTLERNQIDAVFVNVGKSIAAFERTLPYRATRFDAYAYALARQGEAAARAILTTQEREGLRLFIGRAQCATCHSGPRFTDDAFHNTGVPVGAGLPADSGRFAALRLLRASPFTCLGRFSDADTSDSRHCAELRFVQDADHETLRAYRAPSLRGVGARAPYMHAGQFTTLEQVVEHYNRAPASPFGHSELRPLHLTARERAALVAYLRTL